MGVRGELNGFKTPFLFGLNTVHKQISCESSFPLYFVMPGYQLFYKEYLLNFIIFGICIKTEKYEPHVLSL